MPKFKISVDWEKVVEADTEGDALVRGKEIFLEDMGFEFDFDVTAEEID